MEELFDKIGYLNFENKNFLILQNCSRKYYYFLKISEEQGFLYPTMDEFFKLNQAILNSRKLKIMIKKEIFNSLLNQKKFSLVPKIFYKGNVIILTFALLTSILTACNKSVNSDYLINDQTTELSVLQETTKQEVEIINVSGIERAAEYLDIKNPSWDDLLNCVEKNININSHYKELIIKGINNLKKNIPDLRLDILYYNISGLKILEQDRETFAKKFSDDYIQNNAAGLFEANTRTVYVCTDEEDIESILFHELLGHGSNILDIHNGNMHMKSSAEIYNCDDLDYSLEWIFFDMGYSFDEALAEMIALLAQDKPLSDAYSYTLQVQELAVLLEVSGLSLADISNEGLKPLINAICDMNINCFNLINNSDNFQNFVRMGSFDIYERYLISNNIKAFLLQYYNYLIDNGYESLAAISEIERIGKKCDMGYVSTGFLIIDSFNMSYMLKNDFPLLINGEKTIDVDLSMDEVIKKENKKTNYSL